MAKRLTLKWLAGITLAVLVAGGVVAYTSGQPLAVRVATVEEDIPIQVFGLGTVEAQAVSRIGFETAGTLIELKADHGDTVKAGALLARLQSREQDAHAAQARAAVRQAEAAVEQSTSAVEKAEAVLKQKASVSERRHKLVERGIVSQETAEDTLSETEVAKAVLALEEARLAKYSLFAPFDAIVMTRQRELGSALNANETVFTLVDPATIWALAYIDEARAGGIEIGQAAQVTRRSAPDFHMPAKVVRIDIESDRVNEERRVYVRCGGCPLTFHLGEQAEVLITVATLPSARLVKLKSLANLQRREATAWTIEDGRLAQRTVTLGARTLDGRVEITGGVPDRAEVVDDTVSRLKIGGRAAITNGARS